MNKIVFLLYLSTTYAIAQSSYTTANSIKFSGKVVKVEEVLNKTKLQAQKAIKNKPEEIAIKKKTKLVAIKLFSTKYVIDYIRTIHKIEQVQYYKGKIEILPDHDLEKEALKYKVMSKTAEDVYEQKAYGWLALYFSYRNECEKGSRRHDSLVPVINNVVDSYFTNTNGKYGKISKVSKCKALSKSSINSVSNKTLTATQ